MDNEGLLSRRRVAKGALAVAGALGLARSPQRVAAGGGGRECFTVQPLTQLSEQIVEVPDSSGNPYTVRELNDTLIKMTNDSRFDYDEDRADKVIAFVDDICGIEESPPNVSHGVNKVTVYMRVQPGCTEKLLQHGISTLVQQ